MQHGMGKQQDRSHDELRQHVRQHMADRHRKARLPEFAGKRHVGRVFDLQHLGAHHARQAGPVRERDAHHHAEEALANGVGDQDQQHDMGNAQHEVDKPRDRGVDLAPAESRSGSERQGDQRAGSRGQKADQDALGQTRDRAHQHVMAETVGAERMLERRRKRTRAHVGLHRLRHKRHAQHRNRDQDGRSRDRCDEYATPRRHATARGTMDDRTLHGGSRSLGSACGRVMCRRARPHGTPPS